MNLFFFKIQYNHNIEYFYAVQRNLQLLYYPNFLMVWYLLLL